VQQRLLLRLSELPLLVAPTTPLPSKANPRVVFERLFGEGATADARRSALGYRASLLDSFTKDIARFKQRVGVSDRVRLYQYVDSVRQVEREIQAIRCRLLFSGASARNAARIPGPRLKCGRSLTTRKF
jgi:hypothetical protein